MQPQDIEKAVCELTNNESPNIIVIIDGVKIYMPKFELVLVDGAIMLKIMRKDGALFGVFDTRSVAGIMDANCK